MTRIRVAYVIAGLTRGGAEKQLYTVLAHLDRDLFDPLVVTLSAGGAWADPIRDLGVPVVELPRRRHLEAGRLLKLVALIRRARPEIVQTFLVVDNFYGQLAAGLAGVPIRIASRRIEAGGGRRMIALDWVSERLVRRATAIVCNAERLRRGGNASWASPEVVIPNAVEPPRPSRSRTDMRARLDLGSEQPAIGVIARLVPQKNHALAIDVAARVARVHPSARFLLVGGGPLADQLRARIAAHGLGDVVRLLGERADVPDVLEALDALLLTSHREGMPNAVLEAMAAGLPCVVTDAGGAPEIVLDGVTGYVCPRGNAEGLTASLVRLIERPDERRRLGRAGQHRAVTEFSVARLVTRTQALYQTLLAEQDPAHAPARQHRVAV